jgi:hypothetical protein
MRSLGGQLWCWVRWTASEVVSTVDSGADSSDLRAFSNAAPRECRRALHQVCAFLDLAKGVGGLDSLVVPCVVGQPRALISRKVDPEVAGEPLWAEVDYADRAGILLMIGAIDPSEAGLVTRVVLALVDCARGKFP